MLEQLPVAESFHSIQGEGHFVGVPMYFVRLAGCPVGAKATKKYITPEQDHRLPFLSNGHVASMCQTYDERFFVCDTDFSCHTYKTVAEIFAETWENHICLTGGEPLIHQNKLIEYGFFDWAAEHNIQIHIETSGTVLLDETLRNKEEIWITVAPKLDYSDTMIGLANEIKFLVDEKFDLAKAEKVMGWLHDVHPHVFLSPINDEKVVNQKNVELALDILRDHPDWKLSCQWHKFLNLR